MLALCRVARGHGAWAEGFFNIETSVKRPERYGIKVIFVNAALDRFQVMQRLNHGGVEFIDPQPAPCRNG